jgi:hypothetical protein
MLRAAGRKYQGTDAGKQRNAQRQARWRERQRCQTGGSAGAPVTHPQAARAEHSSTPVPSARGRTKHPRPEASIAMRPPAHQIVRRNFVHYCDFCLVRKVLFASRKGVWPGPTWGEVMARPTAGITRILTAVYTWHVLASRSTSRIDQGLRRPRIWL